MSNLAIIPARSGSKGLKNKNIREINGKPLIAYSIEAAIQSGAFDEVMVSTDSELYADIAKQYGAKVPFLRSGKTSTDTASSWDMVDEVLQMYLKDGKTFDTFMLLQPTSPLRTKSEICDAYELMENKNADAIVSVCEAEHPPMYCNTIPHDYSMTNFLAQSDKGKRRQDNEKYYRLNGAIYLAKVDFFLMDHDIYRQNCYALIMRKENSVDIDDEYDFIVAEALLKKIDR